MGNFHPFYCSKQIFEGVKTFAKNLKAFVCERKKKYFIVSISIFYTYDIPVESLLF